VWIHAVDLDVGASFADMPAPMLAVLITDVSTNRGTRPGSPRMVLEDTDSGTTVEAGPGPDGPDGPSGDLGIVRGAAPDLAAWLLGRTTGTGLRTADGKRPGALPAWL
jgi:maleylpyruvate isomerase